MTQRLAFEFKVGQYVERIGTDYTFRGVIVGRFPKLSGAPRYVVENGDGLLQIFTTKELQRQLKPRANS